MSDTVRVILPFLVFIPFAVMGSLGRSKIRERGRGEWLSSVGRPPRDLFADRRVNFVANLVHEWIWIGFSVAFIGFMLLFPDSTMGISPYVTWLGIGMMFIGAIVGQLSLLFAKLAPQYEAQAAASVAANSAGSLDTA
jgi:hypothetical protein